MKRTIYLLTAIFSAVIAAILIIEYITALNQYGEFYGGFFFSYSCIDIAVLLALGILSLIQLKKHTPRIMLILCGYIFYESVLSINSQYLFGLLLMAAALIPAIYEFSRYGMTVRKEPKRNEQSRWMLIAAIALALALSAYRVMLIIMQAAISIAVNMGSTFEFYTIDYVGISAIICFAVFCALMNRRTSVLYRMFFTGCIVFDAVQIVFTQYSFSSYYYPPDTVRMLFICMTALYTLPVLLILIHSSLTRRYSLISQEASDITGPAFNNAKDI